MRLPALGAAPPPATMALPSGDTVNANVPLFGTLPLSTTEPVAPPAPAGSVALTNAPGENGVPSGGSMVDKEGSDDAPEKSSAPASHSTYGHGKVRNPHTVRLKMDSPVQDIKGSVTEASLTVTVPGRHNIEPATPLSKRDKRIVAVKATPNGHGTDVTIVFRDHVPPFLAKANGKMLEIDLGDTSQPADAEDAHGSAKRQAKKGADAEHSSHGHGTHGSKSERAHGKEGKHSAKGKHDEGRGKR